MSTHSELRNQLRRRKIRKHQCFLIGNAAAATFWLIVNFCVAFDLSIWLWFVLFVARTNKSQEKSWKIATKYAAATGMKKKTDFNERKRKNKNEQDKKQYRRTDRAKERM